MKSKSGPHRGMTVEYASVARVEAAGSLAHEFMFEIFDFDAGDYLVTDESSLSDFTEYGSSDVQPFWTLIEAHYGVGQGDADSDLLVDIFEAIIAKRRRN